MPKDIITKSYIPFLCTKNPDQYNQTTDTL